MAEPLLSTIELQATAQLSAAVAAGTLDPAVATTNASAVRHAIGEFRAGRPVDTSGLLPDVVRRLRPGLLVAENARYVRRGNLVHPVAAAAKVAPGTRVLVTAGTRDASIPVSAIKLLAVVAGGASGPPDRDCRCWREWTISCTSQAPPATNPCSRPRWSPR